MKEPLEEKLESRQIDRSDADLWKACVEGDGSAWEELVDRFQRLVYSIPRRARLSEEQCSDVFQDVFLLLFQKLDAIEQPEKIRSWMVTTAKFRTWAVIRSSKGFYSPATDEAMDAEMEKLVDGSPLADDVLIEMEQQHLIRSGIKILDERCRTIISMLYLREPAASYAEVADAVGVGETSISPLRARCLKKLEKILDK